jgi:hypothetical protein
MKLKNICNIARFAILTIMVIMQSISYAQGFKVKDFKQNLSDGSAFHAPVDAEGHPCGLIKVRTDNADLHFKGDIVGNVENKMNEYWVYVPQGCQILNISHPNCMPFVVNFSDYGIDISSKATYILTIEETKFKKEKTEITIIVKPEDADLYIDDVFIDNLSGNGFYQMYLPKGEHVCRSSKSGYSPNVQAFQTGKSPQNISMELESLMAELEVKCKTATAELYIDGELKGNGVWKGEVFAGEHIIEARQQNFNTQKQSINLSEKESRILSIPELKRTMGKLKIETLPNKVPVSFDGEDIGLSPCEIECESGSHYLSIDAYGCNPYRKDIIMESDSHQEMTVELEYIQDDWYTNLYKKAYKGDVNAIEELAEHFVRGHGGVGKDKEAIFWAERHPNTNEFIARYDSYYWILAYSDAGMPEKGLAITESHGASAEEYDRLGNAFKKKGQYDKAVKCYQQAIQCDKYDMGFGLEGIGDCYLAKGDKQRAATYYKKRLTLDYYDGKNRVVKKLKDLGY